MTNLGWKRECEDGKTDWQGKRWWIKGMTQASQSSNLV
jgi:hypothetical protein